MKKKCMPGMMATSTFE
jgi:hypothetical protein